MPQPSGNGVDTLSLLLLNLSASPSQVETAVSRRGGVAADGIARGQVWERCTTGGEVETGRHELTAALEPVDAVVWPAQRFQSGVGVVGRHVVDQLPAHGDAARGGQHALRQVGAILPEAPACA